MFLNYLKIALRNLKKYKAYSFINIFGLAAGLACSILIMLYVIDELSYDQHHEKKDRIYRVTREWLNQDGESSLHLARVAPPIGPLLKQDYPDLVLDVVRVLADYSTLLKVGDKNFVEEKFFWAEENIFDIFSFDMIRGDPSTALKEPKSVVLTESSAKKLFGTTDVLGKYIAYENEGDLKVTGVIKDVPENSHFRFDFLGSFITLVNFLPENTLTTNWGSNNYLTYVVLPEEIPAEVLLEKFPGFLDKHLTPVIINFTGQPPVNKPSKTNKLHLQKLTDIHLTSHLTTELEENGDIDNVYLFSAIAFFILFIACINFMNLATARSARRFKEIGMRKVLGAAKTQLIKQFLGESVIISFLSLIIAITLVELLLSSFNNFIHKELKLNLFTNPEALIIITALTFFVGIMAGSYPAFHLSMFNPIRALKGGKDISGKSTFRSVLVVIQFVISIGLIISMGIVWDQMEFIKNQKLGLNKDEVVVLETSASMRENIEDIKTQLKQNPNILKVASSDLIPSDMLINSLGGRLVDGDKTEPVGFRLAMVNIDTDFIDTYDIKLLAGRNFSLEYQTDDSSAFILNEAAVKQLGWNIQDAVGKPFFYGGRNGKIVGVVQNFNFETLHNSIVPIILLNRSFMGYQMSVKINSADIQSTIDFLKSKWKEYRPDYPFSYTFLDDQFASLYEEEQTLGDIFGLFSILAILIACLGLLGLASFTAEQKTKEIGIRKVLGATTPGIVIMFSKDFMKLIIVANIIAWPLTYYLMSSWLEGFAYRVQLDISTFIISGILALVITLLTVSYQAIKVAIANPVKSLRYE
ncbi:MAG: ABC transporter permease [Ignavibacteriales bacterium]|nr:MAG: ABC transporter permease [Ignavibacteriales bacterium]